MKKTSRGTDAAPRKLARGDHQRTDYKYTTDRATERNMHGLELRVTVGGFHLNLPSTTDRDSDPAWVAGFPLNRFPSGQPALNAKFIPNRANANSIVDIDALCSMMADMCAMRTGGRDLQFDMWVGVPALKREPTPAVRTH